MNDNQGNNRRPHLKINQDNVRKRPTNFEGGGSTYRRPDYYTHGQALIRNWQQVVSYQSSSQDIVQDRVFIEVHLAENEKLKDRYNNLKENSRITILDMISENIGYGVIRTQDIGILQERLEAYATTDEHSGKSYFSFVEEVNTVNPWDKISEDIRGIIIEDPERTISVAIESFSDLPEEIQRQGFLEQIQNAINEEEKIVDSYQHMNGSVVIEANLKADTVHAIVQKFSSVRLVESNWQISLSTIQTRPNTLNDLSINDSTGNAIVCIFDSGITEDNQWVTPFTTYDMDGMIAQQYDTTHGTFVASRVIFRDNIEEDLANGQLTAYAKVLDVRIFGKNEVGAEMSFSNSELVREIGSVVRKYHNDIKVYNLSFGVVDLNSGATTLSDVQVSKLAEYLDIYSKEYGVLFVISAGNLDKTHLYRYLNAHGYPGHFSVNETRILPPGESFLSLCVGSIVTKYGADALGEVNHPSPFSRRGPGFNNTRKPDLVADGGNATYSGADVPSLQAVAMSIIDQQITYGSGTSYAAPIVASYAAELFDKIPNATHNLVKGLLIHFSNVPIEAHSFQRQNIYEHLGFGVPNLQLCLESLRSRATYVHEGALSQQTYYKIPFWIPSILTENTGRAGRKKVRVRITIVWDPLVDRRKQNEYALVHINANLIKRNGEGEEVKVQGGLRNLEGESYKEKYYPVIRLEKQFERAIDSGLWYVELRMSHRWEVPEDYEQNFAVIISVEDPYDQLDVYEAIQNEVGITYSEMVEVEANN
ncbi:S8 family peptidase [Bacillus mobilis]|uniref:S8 family peptidase n=1 Tax=Bacillus mobilis TaxID=2026190 RepID=UPI000A3033F2|nr:S8 family peptidase [Bacillus mobilis]MCU5594592.1 S8 family peptidase [Bacillus mobilis]MCU5738807.1 S8 family peptidase [Bacillus mobilis]MCU9559579.1 S8 family peptidase [Bacillus mobilis]SME29130.1 Subtilase family protein [Bacillus mobilis]HDR7517009.1 S8 family peptidase [Bacillus mobilis]